MASARSGEGRLSPALRKQLVHIRACEKAGETLKGYAERQGLSVQALYEARRRLRERGAAWRVRFSGGDVLESATPLRIDEALRLDDVVGRRS